jgi:ribosomal protein L40E
MEVRNMAGFFEDLGKKVKETAQAAAKKSGELVEVTKLNMEINKTEEAIKKAQAEIGQQVYEAYKAGKGDKAYTESCDTIKGLEEKKVELKQKVLDAKNMKICTGCGAELAADVVFCAKCGAKQEVVAKASEPAGKACAACGAAVPADSAFCTSCGAKVE